jgi:hypothetical protein
MSFRRATIRLAGGSLQPGLGVKLDEPGPGLEDLRIGEALPFLGAEVQAGGPGQRRALRSGVRDELVVEEVQLLS